MKESPVSRAGGRDTLGLRVSESPAPRELKSVLSTRALPGCSQVEFQATPLCLSFPISTEDVAPLPLGQPPGRLRRLGLPLGSQSPTGSIPNPLLVPPPRVLCSLGTRLRGLWTLPRSGVRSGPGRMATGAGGRSRPGAPRGRDGLQDRHVGLGEEGSRPGTAGSRNKEIQDSLGGINIYTAPGARLSASEGQLDPRP